MTETLPSLLGLKVPDSPLLGPLLSYLHEHTSPATVNHSIRAAYWALLINTRLPPYADAPPGKINLELVVLAQLMHDLGWATTRDLLSDDKRFEIDGANLAVKFIEDHKHVLTAEQAKSWSRLEIETLWTAIADHAMMSVAPYHPSPEVVLINMGITADFFGPYLPPPLPPGLITEQEYTEVLKHFPREGFKDEVKQIFCGLCREKPETTFDNWQCQFGTLMGLDGKGSGKEEFKKRVEESAIVPGLMASLDACRKLEVEDTLSKPREKREKYWYEAE